jgi:excisionase family DNA binding protein
VAETFLGVRQVCERLALAKPDTVLAAIHAGQLRAVDVSRPGSKRPTWRIRESDFETFLESRVKVAAPTVQPRRREKQARRVIQFI